MQNKILNALSSEGAVIVWILAAAFLLGSVVGRILGIL